jgi:hypothetical protein
MTCISDITKLSWQRRVFGYPASVGSVSLRLTNMLLEYERGEEDGDCESADTVEAKARSLHHRAFKSATVIYYHQTFDDVLPKDLASYVRAVLDALVAFTASQGGNYTLWPAFIAAVEAYTEHIQDEFRGLFMKATQSGTKNRIRATELVEHVWEARRMASASTGLDPGEIRVDWKQLKRDLQMDILVV